VSPIAASVADAAKPQIKWSQNKFVLEPIADRHQDQQIHETAERDGKPQAVAQSEA
jgi:hypothetical protein